MPVEVLRRGYGMEADTDHLAHGFVMPIREPNAVMNLLRVWEQTKKLRNIRPIQESGILLGLVVEELPSLLAVGSTTLARVTAKLMIAHGVIRLTHPNRDTVAQVVDEVRTTLQLASSNRRRQPPPLPLRMCR